MSVYICVKSSVQRYGICKEIRTAQHLFPVSFNFIPDFFQSYIKQAAYSWNLTSSGEASRLAKSAKYWSHSSFELNCPLLDQPKPA